jgi:hypothetical protein
MTPKLSRLTSLILSIAFAGGLTGGAWAHIPSNPEAVGNLSLLAAASNLVIHGKVTRVIYRVSDAGSERVPYTFVTYSIARVLQGSASGATVTLRFTGGTDGRGGFLAVEGVPTFKVGDEDVLFIAGNGENGCALVMCDFGRYRIFGGAVYEGHGAPVLSVSGDRLVTGAGQAPAELSTIRYPTPSFDEMLKNPAFAAALRRSGMSLGQARARYRAEAPEFIEMGAGQSAAPRLAAQAPTGISVNRLLSSINAAIARAPQRPSVALQSANAFAPLPAASGGPIAAAPRAAPAGATVSPGPLIRKN